MGIAESVLLNIMVYRILVESGMFSIQHIPYCKANCPLCLYGKFVLHNNWLTNQQFATKMVLVCYFVSLISTIRLIYFFHLLLTSLFSFGKLILSQYEYAIQSGLINHFNIKFLLLVRSVHNNWEDTALLQWGSVFQWST